MVKTAETHNRLADPLARERRIHEYRAERRQVAERLAALEAEDSDLDAGDLQRRYQEATNLLWLLDARIGRMERELREDREALFNECANQVGRARELAAGLRKRALELFRRDLGHLFPAAAIEGAFQRSSLCSSLPKDLEVTAPNNRVRVSELVAVIAAVDAFMTRLEAAAQDLGALEKKGLAR